MELKKEQIEQIQKITPTNWWKYFIEFLEKRITDKFMKLLEQDIDPEYLTIQYSEMQVDQKAFKFLKESLKDFNKQVKVLEIEKIREKVKEGKE